MLPQSTSPPSKASLKAWWKQFTFVQKAKKGATADKRESSCFPSGYKRSTPHTAALHSVFAVPLRESLHYASVQISTANANGELYVWGYIPVVVAKWSVGCYVWCGLFP